MRRFVALLLDSVFLTTLGFLLQFGIGQVAAASVDVLVALVYFTALEASAWQATLGKRAVGIRVANLEQGKLRFRHAVGRTAAKCVSTCTPLLLGYAVAMFTTRHQALHDLLASTLVVRKSS